MNGTYYPNPAFPGTDSNMEMNNYTSNIIPSTNDGILDIEQSYIENVLRQNRGKKVKVYASFADASAWKDKIFEGTVEEASRDHVIVHTVEDRYILLPMIYLDYVEFEDKINYLFTKK